MHRAIAQVAREVTQEEAQLDQQVNVSNGVAAFVYGKVLPVLMRRTCSIPGSWLST